MSYGGLLARVRELVTQLDRPPVVAVSGHGGAGKTTVARRLAGDLGVDWQQVLRLDRMYAATDPVAAGLWELHDWPELRRVLTAAREPVPRLVYTSRQYDGDEALVDVATPPVVLVEGIRLLNPETRSLLDLAVWVDLDAAAAAQRAKARNVEQGDGPEALALWDTKWLPEGREYERLVRPRELADVVLPAGGARLG